MVSLMGTPPESFLLRSPFEVRRNWFNEAGEWDCVHREIKVPHLQLEEEERVLKDAGVNNRLFLQFMRRILVWEPEKRATASELLADPWLASVTSSSTFL
jgi:serine/threonine-protein kinase SRPK3